jgi:hypothetical protein
VAGRSREESGARPRVATGTTEGRKRWGKEGEKKKEKKEKKKGKKGK